MAKQIISYFGISGVLQAYKLNWTVKKWGFFPFFFKNNEKKKTPKKKDEKRRKTPQMCLFLPLCSKIHIFKLIASCLDIFFLMSNNFKIFWIRLPAYNCFCTEEERGCLEYMEDSKQNGRKKDLSAIQANKMLVFWHYISPSNTASIWNSFHLYLCYPQHLWMNVSHLSPLLSLISFRAPWELVRIIDGSFIHRN